ncbi:MAG: glycosyltransferase [Chloroflexi bacterium]|nr:glycosyltransferase [Chloroflexota bacterium]MYE77888.1 glycosyltransferase [Chloroflexota bacterium]
MPTMIWLLTLLYVLCALALGLYTAGQALLLWRYWRTRSAALAVPAILPDDNLPNVTVQLPFYNEANVALRLIEAIAALDYPRDKLLIQALDDSTDRTVQLVARKLVALAEAGFRVQHIRRAERDGFKAGALAHGLQHTADDYIAIFDADFIPPADFLRRTLPHLLEDPALGIVQSRWGHLNPEENSLTRAQKLSIDTHFVVEQAARNRSGWLVPFNGTGGIWRRRCIKAAGGWSADTLTEDLDLSYRAQMAGWRSLFLPDVEVPGEIPPQLAAYKQQQARWASGNTQCLRKLAGPLLASELSAAQKIMAVQHLCQYLPPLLMLLLLLLTPPLLLADVLSSLPLTPLGLLALAPPLMYAAGQMRLYPDWLRGLSAFPALLLLGTGMSLCSSLAVLSALLGRRGDFQRTPKFARDWAGDAYALSLSPLLWLELALMCYALWAAALAWQVQPQLLPYLLVYALAFAAVAGWSLREVVAMRLFTNPTRQAPSAPPSKERGEAPSAGLG